MIATFFIGLRSLRTGAGRYVIAYGIIGGFLITAILTLSFALPSSLAAKAQRQSDRYPIGQNAEQPIRPIQGSPLRINQRDTVINQQHVSILEVESKPGVAPPPGLSQLPPVGSSAASPALMALLRSNSAGALATEVPDVRATIQQAGLATPRELFAYVGVAHAVQDDTYTEVSGWGSADGSLFRNDISPAVSLPIAILTLIPLLGLLAGLLRLDAGRRRERSAGLDLLGATALQRFPVDIGALFSPVAVGATIAVLARGPLNAVIADQLFDRNVMFASDLRLGVVGQLAALAIIASLLIATCARESLRGDALAGARGRTEIRVGRRTAVGVSMLVVGGVLTVLVLSKPDSASLQSYGPLFSSAILLLAGMVTLLHPMIVIVNRALIGRGVDGELAAARLVDARASWRSSSLVLLLVGIVAGTALSVLAVLDAATQTQQLLWNPGKVDSNATFVSVQASALPKLPPALLDTAVLILPAGDVTIDDGRGHTITRPGLLVDCQQLAQVVLLPTEDVDRCASAWVVDDGLNPRTPNGRLLSTATGKTLYSEVATAEYNAPASVMNGTESVLLPVSAATIKAYSTTLGSEPVHAIVFASNANQVGSVRAILWHGNAPAFADAQGPLSTVVSKGDLLEDQKYFQKTYSALVIGLVLLGSCCALLTVALVNAVDKYEAVRRRSLLIALGADRKVISRIRGREILTPGLIAITLGTFGGTVLGTAYLHVSGYTQFAGPLAGFPLHSLLFISWIELILFLVLSGVAMLAAVSDRSAPN